MSVMEIAAGFFFLLVIILANNNLRFVAIHCNPLQSLAICCDLLRSVAICCNPLQSVAILGLPRSPPYILLKKRRKRLRIRIIQIRPSPRGPQDLGGLKIVCMNKKIDLKCNKSCISQTFKHW